MDKNTPMRRKDISLLSNKLPMYLLWTWITSRCIITIRITDDIYRGDQLLLSVAEILKLPSAA